jgi:hypothetical protein
MYANLRTDLNQQLDPEMNYSVVLRPEGPFYRVVGECYIYDLEDDETIGWLDSVKCRLETFTLR